MPAESEPTLTLAGDFPAASRDDWRAAVSAVLTRSGLAADDPEAALASTTYDGIAIRPLYTADDATGARAPVGPARSGWDIRVRHADPDASGTNRAALTDLGNGATSLWLTVGDTGIAVPDLPAALEGVYLDLAPVALDAGAQTRDAATALLDLARERGVAAGQLSGTLGADPIGTRARTGAGADLPVLAELAALSQDAPRLCVATVDGTVYHDAGGSDSDELAIATSVGVAYLRALTDSGLSVDAALDALEFRFAVTADQFLSIAKLRAARRIWARVAELSGAAGARVQRQHAVTSAAMMTRRDPWVNLLRTTIACFAAAVGGADAISVAPFDSAIGLPDDFARRIARNTSTVLHDESSLARVLDAAGGSWYVESLTDELAGAAWEKFTALEKAGGVLAALDSGAIAELVGASQAARADDIAHRRAPITGVSEYAFVGEAPVTRPAAPSAAGAGLLPSLRYAEGFEALRDRSDAAPERPKVFLAALGPFAAHEGGPPGNEGVAAGGSRVGFATNLFAAGGIAAVVGTGEADALVSAFRDSGSTVACLCSSDKIYAESAESEAAALKAAGARYVWLAGQPGERAHRYQSAGIDGYLFAGCDALDVLRSTLDTLGVPA